MSKLRTAFLTASVVVLCAAAPSAGADPVDVETGTTPVCLVDTTPDGNNCDYPSPVPAPTVCVTAADHTVGILTVCQ